MITYNALNEVKIWGSVVALTPDEKWGRNVKDVRLTMLLPASYILTNKSLDISDTRKYYTPSSRYLL